VREIAKQAGQFIKSELNRFNESDIVVKDFNSLVSYVDIEAEKLIVNGLKELIPDAGFVTEEETIETTAKKELNWIIDPLDGTTNFMHGLPYFSVSIALRENDKYVLGVVYDIMHDVLFEAVKGNGARANGKPIHVTKEAQLSNAVLATGFPYNSFDWMERYLNLFRELFQKTRGIRRFGSAALDLCYVARGNFASFYEYGLSEWDVAAGICIVEEAGGQVCDFSGGTNMIPGKTIIASSGKLHGEILQIIQKHFER